MTTDQEAENVAASVRHLLTQRGKDAENWQRQSKDWEARAAALRVELDDLRTERRALCDILSADVTTIAGQTLPEAMQAVIADRDALAALLREARIYVDRMTIQVGPAAHDDIAPARRLLWRIDAALGIDTENRTSHK